MDIKENVRKILVKYPECRENDLLLILYYYREYNNLHGLFSSLVYHLGEDQIRSMINPSTIWRQRQRFNELGQFLPPHKVVEARESKRKTFMDTLIGEE